MFASLTLVVATGVVALSCARLAAADPGADGSHVVTTPDTVLNRYAALAADAAAGDTVLTITTAGALDAPAPFGPLAAGDLLLVIQMQGAVLDTADGPAFGAVVDLGGAGSYELVRVGEVSGDSVVLDADCGGLRNAYDADGSTQLVRAPEFTDLIVQPGASLTASPWNGAVGGIVAVHVDGSLTVDGAIDASASGFRGGAAENVSSDSAVETTAWRSTDPADGAEKGESVGGDGTRYDAMGGRYGRAAAANGGGGGTAHNGGGGGGANAGDPADWNGQGVMDPGTPGAAAWALDPAFAANGNQPTTSSGGGRGGYTFGSTDQDALALPPGDPAWGGNQRRDRGGFGGRPLDADPVERIFAGGGGGAGDGNNGGAGAGGRGGGIVLLLAGSVGGSGSVRADGGDGVDTSATHNDAPGGGGGGGTIVIDAGSIAGVTLSAAGGAGGDQLITNDESEGPGGGGGGGRIALRGGTPVMSAAGGANGTTTSLAVTEFPANGATRGGDGRTDLDVPFDGIPICRELGVEGSGCVCRTTAARPLPRASLVLLLPFAAAFALARRRWNR